MANYNPNATETLGPELLAAVQAQATVNSSGAGVATSILSLGAETINEVRPFLARCDVAGTFVVEVYPSTAIPDAQGGLGGALENTYNMNEDVTVTNVTGVAVNTAGNRYQNLDEGAGVYNPADYIRPTTDGTAMVYEGRVGSAAYSGRPLYVTQRAVIDLVSAGGVASSQFNLGLNLGGVVYGHTSSDVHNVTTFTGPAQVTFEATWYRNPSNNLPWTVADIQSFDSTNELYFQMIAPGFWHFGPFSTEHLVAMDLVVGTVTETRVAIASATLSTFSTPAYTNFTLTAIGGGNWSKSNAVNYYYILRRTSKTGSVTLQGVSLTEASPITNFAGFSVTLDGGMPTAVSNLSRWYGFVVRTSAPADSADSCAVAGLVEEPITTGVTCTTEFSNAAAKTYGIVTVLVKYTGAINQSLDVLIKRRSDNVQFGSTFTITKAMVDALPDVGGGFKKLKFQLASSATLAAATQYYWQFQTVATIGSWYVVNLYTGGVGALFFGGTTDRSTRAGVENDSYDIQATLATIPTVPGSWAVSLANQTVPGDDSEGTLKTVQYANCTWAATSLAGLFSYYEIQRTEDAGTTWVTVAIITLEATVAWKDYEGKRNVSCGYRIRVQRTDGAFSPWSSTQSQTPAKLASDVWSFVSNENQGALNCIYKKLSGGSYRFPSADEQELHPIFGQNYYLVQRPTEDRGAQTEISVVMSSLRSYNQGSNTLGWALYTRLRQLSTSDLDYVCVHDPWGNRMLAVLAVPEAPIGGEGPWVAVIRIAQITDTFTTPAT